MEIPMTTPAIDRGRATRSTPAASSTAADLDAIAATSEWYVTAHTVGSKLMGGRLVEFPVSQAHAKRMGTLLTACGAWSYSWRKIYDLPFPLPQRWRYRSDSCPVCLDVVAGAPIG
jgi:hypothetical protein